MNARRTALATALAFLAGSAGLAGTAFAPTASAASTLGFGHEVVIDHQRSGFEPDIVIDSKGKTYSSVPNGSSQGHSYIWQSVDKGDSFQLIPGNAGVGKPANCVGGGDTELARDAGDNLYFSDLQNLTNLSNSVSTDGGATFTASCTSAPNAPVDRMWFASHGKLGDPDFAIYEEYDAVASGLNPDNPTTNQLVETVSYDGANYLPVVNDNITDPACLGGGVVNCVTNEEGLPGNQILSKKGDLVIAHSGADGNKILASVGKLTVTGSGLARVTTATWKDVVVNKDICPDKTSSAPGICGSANFPTVAQDSAGNLYMVYASQLLAGNTAKGPYNVYVSTSTDGGSTWGRSVKVSTTGSNAFPWITAGSDGRVAVAWYHANEEGEKNKFAFDDLAHAEFDVQVAQSINATAVSPHWTVVTASEHPMKYGPICTAGTACTVTMGDRSLGDYLNLAVNPDGSLGLVYVDDTSDSYATGPLGDVAENGPPVYQRQISGPSMIAGKTFTKTALPMESVTDPTGDSFYNANAMRTATGANLDLTGASVKEEAGGVALTMKVRSLENTAVSPLEGGTTGVYLTRFTTYNPATPGNGHIYYAGAEVVAGGTPRFFVGDVAPAADGAANVQISMLYNSATTIKGTLSPSGTIVLHVPYSAVPGVRKGKPLYSVTAVTATTVGTLGGLPYGIFNVTDATAPFNHVARGGSTATGGSHGGTGGTGNQPGGSGPGGGLAATGGLGQPVAALVLLVLGVGLLRLRRRLA